MPERYQSLDEQAQEIVQQSLAQAERLLAEGHPREAVQEIIWLMEFVVRPSRPNSPCYTRLSNMTREVVGGQRRSLAPPLFHRAIEPRALLPFGLAAVPPSAQPTCSTSNAPAASGRISDCAGADGSSQSAHASRSRTTICRSW